ncbi:phosphoribosyl 1,2-cyclic phosphate phosphodiesterase [Alphaproteobacteria bacterium]
MSSSFRYIILGCGGSDGVPQIGCKCDTCTSTDPRNKRTRASIMIVSPQINLLVDTSPDLRWQALQNNITAIDGVLYTHAHFDHIAGINDVKCLSRTRAPIPVFADNDTAQSLLHTFGYMFEKNKTLYRALMHLNIFDGPFCIKDVTITPFPQQHVTCTSYGFRFGNLAYSTDVCEFTEVAYKILDGVDIWIIDCMRYCHAPTHCNFEKTLQLVAKVKPKLAILTHMAHDIQYSEISKLLPPNIIPGYDGMEICYKPQLVYDTK